MINYKEMTSAQLLEELSYMEQLGFAGEVQALDIREELQARKELNNTLVPEVDETPEYIQKEVMVYDKKRKKYNYTAFNTLEVERIKIGYWIIVDAYMKGTQFTRLAEQVKTIRETAKFYVLNGKRIKKGTIRVVLQ